MKKFNLIEEPWIPCIMPDGSRKDFGIKDVLCKSHEIREIRNQSPIVTLSVYRLLLVILQRIFDISNLQKWESLCENGKLNDTATSNYLNKPDIYSRFYLVDNENNQPFLQASTLSSELKDEDAIPLSKLAREMAATTNATLFDHSNDVAPIEFPLPQAARLLIADYFYCLADGTGYARSQCTDGINLLATGGSLFHTLTFNIVIRNRHRPIPCDIENDLPVWEQDKPFEDRTLPNGYLDYMTWPFRRLLLLDCGKETLAHVYRKSGLGIESDWKKLNHDSMVHYKVSDEKGHIPVRLRKHKALWRDYSTFLTIIHQNQKDKLPYFANLLARTDKVDNYSLQALGTCHGNADVQLWRHETFPLSIEWITDIEIQKEIGDAIELAENKIAYKLFSTIKKMETGIKAESVFWGGMEFAFKQFIDNLSNNNAAKQLWVKAIRKQISETWRYLMDSSGNNPRLYKDIITNQAKVDKFLTKPINEYLKQETEHE